MASDPAAERAGRIVADPYFEEIPQDVEGLGVARRPVEEIQEQPGRIRAFVLKMKIGDQISG
jgi:hypothetical protein